MAATTQPAQQQQHSHKIEYLGIGVVLTCKQRNGTALVPDKRNLLCSFCGAIVWNPLYQAAPAPQETSGAALAPVLKPRRGFSQILEDEVAEEKLKAIEGLYGIEPQKYSSRSCECGSEACGSSRHSTWCPRFENDEMLKDAFDPSK
jgi:hypothetical protein